MKVDEPSSPWSRALSVTAHDPPRILVAEDDAEMRRLVVEALRKDGYDVVPISDGGRLLVNLAHEAADCGGADRADLVVSDVRMPICTGMQILEQLRAVGWPVPVILMTAFGDEATRDHARALGAILFDKPFELRDLRAAVAMLLGRNR